MPRTSLSPAALVALIALGVAATACSEPLVFADWRVEVAPGTAVIELPAVPLDERDRDAVQLVDDLVFGNDPTQPESLFYRPVGIVAAADGRVFVADGGASRVLMFAPDGAYLGGFGREGQGPGELGGIFDVAIVDDRIVVEDVRNRRLSVWSLDGVHLADHALAPQQTLMQLEGAVNDTLAATSFEVDAAGNRHLIAALHDLDGSERLRLFDVPTPPVRVIRHGPGIRHSTTDLVRGSISTLGYPDVVKAVGAGLVYLSPAHEYQVVARAPDGETRWALRVAWPRSERALSDRQRIVDVAMRSGDVTASVYDFDWPPAEALEFLRTDAMGRLYAFPTMPREEDAPPVSRMVDVYSPDGDFLAAGLVDHVWSHARGDYVYGLRTNEREEQEAVRYRLTVDRR